MTGKSLSTQQIAALCGAYKIRQTANYVATHCRVSRHTAAKYILNHNFAQRFAKLQAKANDILDEDQAKSLANTLRPLANLRAIILKDLLAHVKNGEVEASFADVDRIIRLERYLRGEPDSHIEQDFSFEWLDDDDGDKEDPENPGDPEIFRHQEKM